MIPNANSYNNFAEAWYALLGELYRHGIEAAPRGFETRELLGVTLRVNDMRNNILIHSARALSYRFMVAEWLWIAAGRADVETVSRYNKNIAQFSDDTSTFNGAYGPQLQPQMPYLLEQLRKPFTRQAVATIWRPNPKPSKDIPCTISWQLFARDGKLHGIVSMRSSDIWLGLPYDFYNFSQLTNGVAGELGLAPGELIFNLGSSHLYDRDREKASKVLNDVVSLRCARSPALPNRPPAEEILNKADALQMIPRLPEPWCFYYNTLVSSTNAAALRCLEDAYEQTVS